MNGSNGIYNTTAAAEGSGFRMKAKLHTIPLWLIDYSTVAAAIYQASRKCSRLAWFAFLRS
jgi:hypothetical protein